MDDGEVADLALLISIIAQIEGIDRIRFTTSHPVEFSDRLIETYAEVPELVSHLHLPVQAGLLELADGDETRAQEPLHKFQSIYR